MFNQSVYKEFPTKRTLVERNKIRLIVVQTGDIVAFKFTNLLLSVVTSIALWRLGTFIVDLLALMIFPKKKEYRSYKFERVPPEPIQFNEDEMQVRLTNCLKWNLLILAKQNGSTTFAQLHVNSTCKN